MKPTLIILAGVNGAGKSSYAKKFIQDEKSSVNIINPDDLGYKESLKLARKYIQEKRDFLRETTLTGKTIFSFIDYAKQNQYEIVLIYIYVNDYKICIQRVKDRVKLGGHNVPTEDIKRRFETSRETLIELIPQIDRGIILEASKNEPESNINASITALIEQGQLVQKNSSPEYHWISE